MIKYKTFANSVFIALLVFLCVNVHASQLDWDVNTWPSPVGGVPTLSQTYPLGTGNVTVTIGGDTAFLVSAGGAPIGPETNTTLTGGVAPAENCLFLRMDFPEGAPPLNTYNITVNYAFDHPGGVNIPSFTSYDIDADANPGNFYQDRAIATATLAAGGVVNPSSIATSPGNTQINANTAQGIAPVVSASGDGNVTFNFGQSGISDYTFTYSNEANNIAGSHNQWACMSDLTFAFAPTVEKDFTPNSIPAGGTSTLTITLGNEEATNAVLSANLVDTLPAGVTVASPPNIGGTCPGTTNAAAAGNTVTYTSGSVIPPGDCTITVDVTSAAPGTYNNVIPAGDLQTNFGNNTLPTDDDLVVTPVVGVPFCPAGSTLINQAGNADAVESQVGLFSPPAGANNALGAPQGPGVGSSTANSAFIWPTTGELVLDMTDTVAEGSTIVLSLGQTGAHSVEISTSNDAVAFTAETTIAPINTVLQNYNYIVPAGSGGARYIRIRDIIAAGGWVSIDAVSYTQICEDAPTVDLTITKDDGSLTYTPGGTGTYTIVVTNAGPDDVTAAAIADNLPNGATLSALWTCTATAGSSCSAASGGVVGGSVVSLTADIVDGGIITVSVPVNFSNNMADY